MAVSRREKGSDAKYSAAIGTRPSTTDREFELEDVVEDLRDDINSICDLSALNEAKVGITSAQASAITANTAKNSFDTTSQAVVAAMRAFSFTYTASPDGGRTPARLTIRHVASRTDFTIDA
ncbi:hypothetical protein [uncultured Mediterranean phage uvMED]|nr:hypothetical protein [uncultured Mediterranean phage uvMED]